MSDGVAQDRCGEGSHGPCAAGLCRVRVHQSATTHLCQRVLPDGAGEMLERGDLAVVETRLGLDIGTVQGEVTNSAEYGEEEILRPVRRATPDDLRSQAEDLAREQEAFEVCRAKIREHGLDMKLVSAHYAMDESKILFLFSSEERIDFRELVRELVSVLRLRVELRQIGVRDEARVVGGMGGCSRAFCCASVTDRLKPVSIKMAKEQNLTLNSAKISGPCGRLLCCLAYEFEAYRDARRGLPRQGAEVLDGDEVFRVEDINVLTQRVRLGSRSGRVQNVDANQLGCDPEGRWRVLVPGATAPAESDG